MMFYDLNDMIKGIDKIHAELERNAALQGKDNNADTTMLELFFHLVWYGFTDDEIMCLDISDYDFVGKKFKNHDIDLHEKTIELIERSCKTNQFSNNKFTVGTKLIRGSKEGFGLRDLMHIKNDLNVSKDFKQTYLKSLTYTYVARCYMYNKFVQIEESTGTDVFKSGIALDEIVRMIHIQPTTATTMYRKEYKEFKSSYPKPSVEVVTEVVQPDAEFNKEEALRTIEQIEIMLADLKRKLK